MSFPVLTRSPTECRMNPNGQLSGKSMNWHYVAVRCADKTNEKCDHFNKDISVFNIDNVRITLTPIEDGLGSKIKFNVKCALCEKLYILTSQKLTAKFIKFYGL